MKRLIKTRALLKYLINKERESNIGTPLTDTDIKNVSKELDLFEKNYFTYSIISVVFIISCFLFIITTLCILKT